MARSKGSSYKEDNHQYIASTGESRIKNDYSAHANIPQEVIIEDMSHDMGSPMNQYEDTPQAIERQKLHDRNKTAGNRPKSRY
jgi:hypothetical protein